MVTMLLFLFPLALLAASTSAKRASITPHDRYSSSIGVLGCKINTDRVAYWPGTIGCNNICLEVSYEGRSLHLLRVDQSGGAFDVSYDAWNQLIFGTSARISPHLGGAFAVDYEYVPVERCRHLMEDGTLAFSAANSMNYVALCLQDSGSWVSKNFRLFNILDPQCKYGFNEICTLTQGLPVCLHTLGSNQRLEGHDVKDLSYVVS